MKNRSNHEPAIPTAQRRGVGRLQWVDRYTDLLDTKLRIPGTGIRFGVDFLLGLIPGAGDALSLAMSGVLIATMARQGASVRLVFRMLFNVVIDAVVGTVPVLGNVFDLFFKANTRNLDLMREHYVEGKHNGSVWPIVLSVFLVVAALFALSLWVIVSLYRATVGTLME